MKKIVFFLMSFSAVIISLIASSCNSSPIPNDYIISKGGIAIVTTPDDSMQVWVNGSYTNKITPDSVINLEPGDYMVTIKSSGYYDSTFMVSVKKGYGTPLTIDMTPKQVYRSIPAVKIYQVKSGVDNKGGALILFTGLAANILLDKDSAKTDIVYFNTNTKLISPADYVPGIYTRKSYFLWTNLTNIKDQAPVPKRYNYGDSDWKDYVPDTMATYFYVFDADSHYSKLKITNRKAGTADSAWVELTGFYNAWKDSTAFK